MARQPEQPVQDVEFFWSPPDGAPILGVTKFRDLVVIATASGVYVMGNAPLDEYIVRRVSSQDIFKLG
jgi:hypothetical protein